MSLITNDYEAFLVVKEHLLNQDEKAINSEDDCQYRGYLSKTMSRIKNEVSDNLECDDYDDNWSSEFYDELNDALNQTPFDAKCAVGVLISDQFYQEEFEGGVIDNNNDIVEAVNKSNPVWKITDKSFSMLQALQSIHDTGTHNDWANKLLEMNTSFDKWKDYEKEQRND